jgi:NAD-dependent dihydropyrimidine dehydrogenase PreA subunit
MEAKTNETTKARTKPEGYVIIDEDECKGCQYCIAVCPRKVLILSKKFNRMGYHPSQYVGEGCTGCGLCFYACPEPGAIVVYKDKALSAESRKMSARSSKGGEEDG